MSSISGVPLERMASGRPSFLQFLQGAEVFREGGEAGVLLHQPLAGIFREIEAELARGEDQRVFRHLPERHVAVGQRAEMRVADLRAAPQRRQLRPLAGEELLGQRADGIHIEQRAVGVEGDGADHGVFIQARPASVVAAGLYSQPTHPR
jgi:hypothetical protein